MNRLTVVSLAALLLAPAARAQSSGAAPESELDRTSYSIGYNIGQGLSRDQLEVNLELMVRGIRDAMEGDRQLLSNEEIMAALRSLEQRTRQRRQQQQAASAGLNQQEGQAFLAENAKRPGVKTLPSGLQYEILNEGSGASPTTGDTVSAHYSGTLIDGTQFDSSYARGEPASFKVTGVIAGWTEALQLMKVGSKWKLYIPPQLAYGEQGTRGGPIGPNATLVFEVELLGIE